MIRCFLQSSVRKMSNFTDNGVHLEKVVNFLENFAPKHLAENWDNTGLLVEPLSSRKVNNVLLTNDLTEDVISEAIDCHADLIISYHPPIFKSIKKLTSASWKERVIISCLENKIAVYSPHTSWDSVKGGVNDWLASAFDNDRVEPIQISNTNSNCGAGRFCTLKSGIKISEAIENVKTLTCMNFLNLALAKSATLDTIIHNVAICAGSGSSVLCNVKSDLYLTGEMSHHSLLDAIHNNTSVILCNHSNSERGFLKEFKTLLSQQFGLDINVLVSSKDKDPLQAV